MLDFISAVAVEYEPDAYDLSRAEYRGRTTPLEVICPDHGPFSITPDNFLYQAGCPQCRGAHLRGYPARRGRGDSPKGTPGRKRKAHWFYIHDVSGGFLKFGITCGSVDARRAQIEAASDFQHWVIFSKAFYDRRLCAAVERLIKLSFETGVAPPGSMRDGATETVGRQHLSAITQIVDSAPSTKIKG